MAERASDHVEQAGEEHLLRFHGNRSGFDLRQVKNVGNQVQQIRSGAMNRSRELDLLVRQIAVGVIAELLAQDKNAVERRAQFMRHVGQELGLVFGSEGQLFRLLFQSSSRLLNFLVLAFHFHVLLGQLLRLLRQLFVGLLQFLLLRLELDGQLLRLFQQAFRLHGGLDAVEHDADAGRQLFKKRQMGRGKGA